MESKRKEYMCEYCGAKHNGTYGSGRFCSKHCARGYATKDRRETININVSQKLKGKPLLHLQTQEIVEKRRMTLIKTLREKNEKHAIRLYSGEKLNITASELDKYRNTHYVCEICGKPETAIAPNKKDGTPNKLCIDHNHETGKFRGLLCRNCNSRLGWYESNRETIKKYLRRGK